MPVRARVCVFALSLLSATQGLRAATTLPVGALLRYKAHYFNLQHRRLRFVPRRSMGYDLAVAPNASSFNRGAPIGKPSDPHNYYWRTRLPFPFAFAGKKW